MFPHHRHGYHQEEEERRRREEEERRQSHGHHSPFSTFQHVAHQEEEERRRREEEERRQSHGHHSPFSTFQHVSHQEEEERRRREEERRWREEEEHRQSHGHHSPFSTVQHVAHQISHHGPFEHTHLPPSHSVPHHDKTFRIFPKAGKDFSLTIRRGQVVLAKADSSDPYQHWIKDEKYSTRVKDKEGRPSFSLINKATGEAIQHSIAETQPVRLTRYNPDRFDESVLWTESKDVASGFYGIRMINDITLNFDAFHGDKDHEGVHDGTTVVLWKWWKGDNELWKIVPY